jgi:hypothetical protein
MPSLQLMNNFKKSIQVKELATDILWGASAAIPYSVVPSGLAKMTNSKFDGWKGWITAVLSTWALGAAFDIPQWRSGAWTLGTQHLMYAFDVLGKVNLEMWRFDDGTIGGGSSSKPGQVPTRPFAALPQGAANGGMGDDGLQPGAVVMTMPDGSSSVIYPDSDPNMLQEPRQTFAPGNGMSDYFNYGEPAPQMASLDALDYFATM